MEYRVLPHGGEKISTIGLGISCLSGTREETARIISEAIDNGINYFDLCATSRHIFEGYADAFEGRREKVLMQMHFGAVYDKGPYAWSRDLEQIKRTFSWLLDLFQTDYTDMGFIHCTDDLDDLNTIMKGNGIWDYMKGLKEDGKIRHLGFSSHNPEIARRILDTGLIDMMMFSINPVYDYQKGDYGIGEVRERAKLYQDCEKMGVGISVMKPFAGGQLLDENLSPFKRVLTRNQCIQYALDRPAVLTALPGIRNMEDLKEILTYVAASEEERDYSVIGEFTPQDAYGTCIYCNHCQPCPAGLNVGLINKYYDLAKAGDALAVGHYEKLDIHASACLQCGHCESRCPFHVKQENRMKEIAEYFGD